MSISSRNYAESESSKVDLPVFAVPTELVFATNKRRSLLTIFNPYDNEAQFRIMTTSPDTFDVNITKGTIKPNRRIDVTIRLVSHKINELPEPTEESQVIGSFRVVLQIGSIKGSKSIKVIWRLNAEVLDEDESCPSLIGSEDRTSKLLKGRLTKPLSPQINSAQTSNSHNKITSTQRSTTTRSSKQVASAEYPQNGSNVNMICTLCAIACVITLFLPLAIDSELCKKVKHLQETTSKSSHGLLSQIAAFLSVSYEMKLGCSFALGLFTYRLISTLPD